MNRLYLAEIHARRRQEAPATASPPGPRPPLGKESPRPKKVGGSAGATSLFASVENSESVHKSPPARSVAELLLDLRRAVDPEASIPAAPADTQPNPTPAPR
jgi:hypothetical protein